MSRGQLQLLFTLPDWLLQVMDTPATTMPLAPTPPAIARSSSRPESPQYAEHRPPNPLPAAQPQWEGRAPSPYAPRSSPCKSLWYPISPGWRTGAVVESRQKDEVLVEEKEEAQSRRPTWEGARLTSCRWGPGAVRPPPTRLGLRCSTLWARRVRKDQESRVWARTLRKATCCWPSARGSSSREPSPMTARHPASREAAPWRREVTPAGVQVNDEKQKPITHQVCVFGVLFSS